MHRWFFIYTVAICVSSLGNVYSQAPHDISVYDRPRSHTIIKAAKVAEAVAETGNNLSWAQVRTASGGSSRGRRGIDC